MSGFFGGIGKLFGAGGSAKTDRTTQLQGFGDLQNVFNFGMGAAKQQFGAGTETTTQGLATLQDPLKYWKTLLTGDRTAMQTAVAPEANARQAAADAQRKQAGAMGTARGGGVAGEAQTAQDKVTTDISNAMFQLRPTAAGQVGKIGTDISQIGLAEISQALGFAGLGEKAAGDITSLAGESRKTSYDINKDVTSRITGTIQAILQGFF